MHPAPAVAPARPPDRSPPQLAASLLRTRPVATGEHFNVHCKPLPAGSGSGVLLMAVPKRLLARAVDRNLVRRLAREAWRGAVLNRQSMAVMVKLARRPASLTHTRAKAAAGAAAAPARARKGIAAATASAPVGSGMAPGAAATGRRASRKLLRAELDRLLATVCRRLGESRP